MSIFEDLISKDSTRIWASACAIRKLRDKQLLAELADQIEAIRAATNGVPLGGALRPNSSHLDFAIKKLEHVRSSSECLCSLYLMDDLFDPNSEAKDGNVQILETTRIDGKWIDFYTCRCTSCGAIFKAEERQYHYSWWAWKRA